MRLLVGITWAHDIEQVANAINDSLTDFDKLFCYYYPANIARHIIKEEFLRHTEYTHLALLPDDLLVTKNDVNLLIYSDLELYPNLPVVCGCCNVDTTDKRDCLNISMILPSAVRYAGTHDYTWIKENSEEHKTLLARVQPIVVMFAGDPFFIFRRDVVELLSFENDARANNALDPRMGCCEDIIICNELAAKNIPIYCDLRARMHHMKISDNNSVKASEVGKKEAYTKWQLSA